MTSFLVGDWRVHPSLNRLARNGEDVRVEPKVMQVLECLAEKPGEVVSRDELVARVWPGVFVTDDVLHRAIRELRRVFGDDTANPKYIETIRKRGYRIIAPVVGDPGAQQSTVDSQQSTASQQSTISQQLTARPFRAIAAVAAVSVALGAAIYAFVSRTPDVAPESTTVRFVALTSARANEVDPSPSPDGKHLAFSMRTGTGPFESALGPVPEIAGQSDIYMSDGPGSTPVRVTTNPADDMLPAWSPDGGTIAFARTDGPTCDVMLLSVADRRERKLTACGNVEEPHLAWSPNGEWLVESFAPGPDPHRGWQIARVSTATGVREALTLPTPGTLGDHSPSVSPDGSRIAFVRALNGATGDIHLVPFSGGTPTRVTSDNQDIIGLDWMPDGRSLVFASDRAGGYSIFRVPVDGGAPQVVAGGSAKLKHPAVARGSGQIVYESWAYEINLWESPISPVRFEEGDGLAAMRPVVQTSDLWNHSPDLSADGKQIAFVSTRSGESQVWAANRDGSSPRQVSTFTRAALRQPRWSAGGTRILISASVGGQPDLFAIDAATGATTRLTDDVDDEIAPSWSHDGASVLFGARRSGAWQVMRLAVADRSRAQVTTDGGYAATESPDSRSILFTRLDATGLWTMPIDGGSARLLVPGVRAAETSNWRVTPNGIYYIGATADQPVIRRAPLTGGNGEDVALITNYSWPGFAVTPDGTSIVFARWDRRESNIMAVETRPSATPVGQTMNTLTAQESTQGWQLLFDGKTLAGWHASVPAPASGRAGSPQPPSPGQVGSSPKPCVAARDSAPAAASHWEVVDGVLTACGEPTGYLTSDRSYKNFVLSIEFRCSDDTNSGVFVRSPQETGGYEVQIWRQQPAGYDTGAIVGVAKTARKYAFKADDWNRYQITADGDHLVVVLNGETTLDIHDTRFSEGQVRLQYQQFPIAFRNIKIRPLP